MSRQGKYYTTMEAAKELGVSVRTIQLWVEDGKLEAWKTAGGHRRITVDSLGSMLSDQIPVKSEDEPIKTAPTILLVEDNPTVLKFYEAAINSWELGVEIVAAEDGFHGLMEVGRINPILIITDIYMPGMDGLQMINALHKHENIDAAQIVVISGLSKESIQERGGIPQDIRFFSKPVDLDKLKQIVLASLKSTSKGN